MDNTIIVGHGRWEAAKKLKLTEVPTICLDHRRYREVCANSGHYCVIDMDSL